jgi:hypothetical protein
MSPPTLHPPPSFPFPLSQISNSQVSTTSSVAGSTLYSLLSTHQHRHKLPAAQQRLIFIFFFTLFASDLNLIVSRLSTLHFPLSTLSAGFAIK